MMSAKNATCGYLLVVTKQKKLYIFGLILILPIGCSYFVSWDEKSERSLGRPIHNYIRLNGSPDSINPLPNGNKEYKYHLKKLDPTCIHYWIVNPQGIIVDYRYEGRCRPIG